MSNFLNETLGDTIPKDMDKGEIYRIPCLDCNKRYVPGNISCKKKMVIPIIITFH